MNAYDRTKVSDKSDAFVQINNFIFEELVHLCFVNKYGYLILIV